MISHLTYQAGQAHLEDIRRYRSEHRSGPRERSSGIRARLTALVLRASQGPDQRVLADAVMKERLAI